LGTRFQQKHWDKQFGIGSKKGISLIVFVCKGQDIKKIVDKQIQRIIL